MSVCRIMVWKKKFWGKKFRERIESEKRFFQTGSAPRNFFRSRPILRKKFSGVGPVWRGLRGGSVRTDPLHHRGFPHSAARARATCLPLPADPAPMFPSAALPRAPSLPTRPRAPLRGPELEPA